MELKELDNKILESIIDDAEYEAELIATGEKNRLIRKIMIAIKEELELRPDVKPDVKAADKPVNMQSSDPGKQHRRTRLPQLHVPKFNGDPLQFRTFWDTFECVVHNDETLDDMEKFTYLRDSLDGKAKILLEGLTLTKGNYTEARKLLKERFGDEQSIIQAHMDALIARTPVQQGNVEALRELCDIIEVHIRNLQLFKITVENYGPVLISIILAKLPGDVSLEIN